MLGMTPKLALHTFGRRYCIDKFAYWWSEYSRIVEAGLDRDGAGYSDNAYAIFPKYNVLHAILLGVEFLDPEHLPNVGKLTDQLMNIGLSANTDSTGNLDHPIGLVAEQEERNLFVAAIETATKDGLPAQEPLFYRRVLSVDEVEDLRRQATEKWGITDGYWYPLSDRTHPSLVALELVSIDETKLQNRLKRFFADTNVERIFELREHGPENYLVAAGSDDLDYNGAEGYWFSKANDWVVYCSHEDTITLGGTIADITRKNFK